MKKILLTASVLGALCLGVLTGCGDGSTTKYRYENASAYSTGGTSVSASVRELEIEWVAGSVQVKSDKDATEITFSETFDGNEEYRVRYAVAEQTLTIKFAKSDIRLPNNLRKDLTVTVPESLVLSEIELEGAAVNFTASKVIANELSVETASGNISISDCAVKKIDAESMSGNINVKNPTQSLGQPIAEISLETVSGEIVYENDLKNDLKSLEIETASGRVSVKAQEVPSKNIKVSTMSGNVEFYTEALNAFTFEFSSVSGKVTDYFGCEKTGGIYTANGGGNKVVVNTASGNAFIHALDNGN